MTDSLFLAEIIRPESSLVQIAGLLGIGLILLVLVVMVLVSGKQNDKEKSSSES